jgi:hypothetical protein
MPSSRQARIILTAISPLLAISIFLNILAICFSFGFFPLSYEIAASLRSSQ